MKPIIVLLLVSLLASRPGKAQSNKDTLQNPLNKTYYTKLSKVRKTEATILAVTGGAVMSVGLAIWSTAPLEGLSFFGGDYSEEISRAERKGIVITILGLGLTAISIPLFHDSKENRKKAKLYVGSGQLEYPLNGSKGLLSVGAKITLK